MLSLGQDNDYDKPLVLRMSINASVTETVY